MKIDIHTHTKKCKSGDAPTREISPDAFCDTVLSTEVGIIAITNHNVFDLTQYNEITSKIGTDVQVWPGIEFDVVEEEERGHLLVIVSPANCEEFYGVVNKVTEGHTPDSFTINIDKIIEYFDNLNPLYVAHYKQKKPNITDETIDKLASNTLHANHIIKEVSNSLSAGIYISHGKASIYGSDVHDWNNYKDQARELPDLRLPVESFEHFCLLLDKDPTTINTALDKKVSEDIYLTPFEDSTNLALRVYNDINVIFGPKGTGKSCILDAIAKHYSNNGIDAKVYESTSDLLDEMFDIKGRDLSLNLNNYDINYCKDEIDAVRDSSEANVTSLSKYIAHFLDKTTNKNAKKIKIKDIEPEQESKARREFIEFNNAAVTVSEFLSFIEESPAVKKSLDNTELADITTKLEALLSRLLSGEWDSFSWWKEIELLNSAIKKFRTEIERKTGSAAKPTTTGFRDYAINRVKIEANAAAIIDSIDTNIPVKIDLVGNLGPDKGTLELRTEFKFQNGSITDGALNKLKNIKKGSLKKFSIVMRAVKLHAYSDDLFKHITELNKIEDIESIETVYELLLFKRYFALDDSAYTPSSGEASMVMLQKELETDKDIYILDEPERSLGNEYINDVIVPLIKERARASKKIFISTHDANIAVRTLPYSSIYRRHGPRGYETYTGNPYSNDLVNTENDQDRLDWKKTSMTTLEGGVDAFGERGKIYGND